MSFSVSLMNTPSENNRLDKQMNTIYTATGTLKEATSILNPVIKIQCSLSSIVTCNYMYIPQFARYYFIDNIKSITNDIIEVSAHVDVLTTYATGIRGNSAIVRKQENRWNLYLNDGSFKVYQDPQVITKAFPSGFSTQEFVLAVAGS